jgi:hypothetical protein
VVQGGGPRWVERGVQKRKGEAGCGDLSSGLSSEGSFGVPSRWWVVTGLCRPSRGGVDPDAIRYDFSGPSGVSGESVKDSEQEEFLLGDSALIDVVHPDLHVSRFSHCQGGKEPELIGGFLVSG